MEEVAKVIDLNYDWYPAYNTVPEKVRQQLKEEGKPLPHQWIVLMQQVPEKEGTPYIHDITIRNLTAKNCGTAFTVAGRENQKAGHFMFENITISAQKAGTISNAENWVFKNTKIETSDGLTPELKNCVNIEGLSSDTEK